MKNALTYLTRSCPRHCQYCAIRDTSKIGKQLSINQWIDAFAILKKMEVTFNLILGNEPWLYRAALIDLFRQNTIPYGMYTTAVEPLFSNYRDVYFKSGVIDNLSCGIDFAEDASPIDDDSYRKSVSAWAAFRWVKSAYPNIDTQGTITIHKQNLTQIPKIVAQLDALGVYSGMNLIHWNKDGGFDFFPAAEEIPDFVFTKDDLPQLQEVLSEVLQSAKFLHVPEYIEHIIRDPQIALMNWHCEGDPYGGPTIDADGTLRVCGYRKGERTSKFTIWDLPEKEQEWKEAVSLDAKDCVGCMWSCAYSYHYWKSTNSVMGEQVFTSHAGTRYDTDKWSKRTTK